jgi:hypothetical protein
VKLARIQRQVLQKIDSVAFWPVPHYDRGGLYPQAIFLIGVLIWFEYRPSWASQGPGVAMAFLAVAAIVMAVRGVDATRAEGVIWIIFSVVLFAGEMHFISVERLTHDAEQRELRLRGEETQREQARSFEQLIRDGKRVFDALAAETALTAKNLEHITGGDEYCWVVPEPPLPFGLGGDPVPKGDGWWQLNLKNSGKVQLPTCDVRFMPSPTDRAVKAQHVPPLPPYLFYHFEKVPVMGRRYATTTPHFISDDAIYSGVIQTPTRTFIEVIKFEPDPKNPTRYIPNCLVAAPSGKVLEKDCNPQK